MVILRQALGSLRAPEPDALAVNTAPPLATLPAERSGISGQVVAMVDLPATFPLGSGRQLRMRQVTIVPGGFLPMHSHAERPAVAYVLQGTLTEYLEGEAVPVEVRPGQAYATHLKPHALLNRGSVPVVFLEIDLL